jgi:chlorinating enzyme
MSISTPSAGAARASSSPHRLTDQQVARYRQDGYIVMDRPLFSPTKFKGLADHFEELLARHSRESTTSPEHMDTPHFANPSLFRWLFDDEVLDVVESIIGPDIALWSSHFICKPPAVGKRVPWHEDSAYWRGRLDPMEVVTVWLAIDPSTTENGCMRVIPGTHHHGFSEYEPVTDPSTQVFNTEIKRGLVDEGKAVDIVLKPNHASLHHGKLIHGSNANKGVMRRCGYTMRYIPTSVKFSVLPSFPFQIYLARGKDKAGNSYGDPSKPFHGAAPSRGGH